MTESPSANLLRPTSISLEHWKTHKTLLILVIIENTISCGHSLGPGAMRVVSPQQIVLQSIAASTLICSANSLSDLIWLQLYGAFRQISLWLTTDLACWNRTASLTESISKFEEGVCLPDRIVVEPVIVPPLSSDHRARSVFPFCAACVVICM